MPKIRFTSFGVSTFVYVASLLGVVSFSQFMVELFSQTIPSHILSFFKVASEVLILLFVFTFALLWLFKAVPKRRRQSYKITVFDMNAIEFEIDGIRTSFKQRDVAWSFMKIYKKDYPLYNFALLSDLEIEKKTIIRYI